MAVLFTHITDLAQIKSIWNELSPNKTIYDDWQFRDCFYKYNPYSILGIVATDNKKHVGLLVVQDNTDKNCWEFFGGTYMEDNRVLISLGYESLISQFYTQVPTPAKLYSMVDAHPFVDQLPLEANKYVLPLNELKSFEDYLIKFLDADARGKFRRKIRKVERENLQIRSGQVEDIAIMIKFNQAQFGDHSAFTARPHLTEIFHDLTKLGWPVHLYGFLKDGVPIAASFAIVYNGVYEYFNLGTNKNVEQDNLRDLATFVHKHNVEMAIAANCRLFDAFTRSYGWKEHWHFTKIPQHELLNP